MQAGTHTSRHRHMQRCTRVLIQGGGMDIFYQKIREGGSLCCKNCQREYTLFVFYCILINKFFENCIEVLFYFLLTTLPLPLFATLGLMCIKLKTEATDKKPQSENWILMNYWLWPKQPPYSNLSSLSLSSSFSLPLSARIKTIIC